MAVTVVVGAEDAKFRALGQRLAAGIGPTARVEVVPGAGHACHLQDPGAVAALVRAAAGT